MKNSYVFMLKILFLTCSWKTSDSFDCFKKEKDPESDQFSGKKVRFSLQIPTNLDEKTAEFNRWFSDKEKMILDEYKGIGFGGIVHQKLSISDEKVDIEKTRKKLFLYKNFFENDEDKNKKILKKIRAMAEGLIAIEKERKKAS